MAAATIPEVSARTARLPLLDGLRGIAALVVVYYHAHHLGLARPLVLHGYLFVDFFFLLSGFVLALSAEPKFAASLGAAQFMRLRIRRLWPVMAIGSLIGLLPYAHAGVVDQALPFLPFALLIVPALFRPGDSLVFPLNSPQWSLCFELLANAFHVLVLSRIGSRHLLVIAAISAIWLGAAIIGFGSNEFGAAADRWYPGLARVTLSYTVGLLLAREYRRASWIGRLQWHWTLSVLAPVVTIATMPLWPMPDAASDILVTMVLFPLTFAFTINTPLPVRLVPMFTGLGLISYPLYGVHMPVLTLASQYLPDSIGGFLGPALALWVAALVARWLEVGWRPSAGPAGGSAVRSTR